MKHSYIDKYSNLDSIIHQLDPRIKSIYSFMFILFVVFTPPWMFLSMSCYGLVVFVLILLSRVPLGFIFKRSLVVVPFVVTVAVFIPFLKKGTLGGGYSFGTLSLKIDSWERWMVFWNIVIKSFLSILIMILLVSSTKLSDLLKAFEKMKVPSIFTMILSFMYRYIFVVTDELMKMQQAKDARTTTKARWLHNKALANMIGVLFIRSYERAENVYLAMSSRGFNGTVKTMNSFSLKPKDLYFLMVMIVLLFLIRFVV